MVRTSKGFCTDSRARSGQSKGNTRTFQGQKRQKRTYGDKPRTEDKKDLRRAATKGMCFTKTFTFIFSVLHNIFLIHFIACILNLQWFPVLMWHYPRSLNVSRTLFFTNCLGVVFLRTLHLARERTAHEKRRQLRSMFCISLCTNSLIWLHFDFSDCLLLEKWLIIECSEILSDLGYLTNNFLPLKANADCTAK